MKKTTLAVAMMLVVATAFATGEEKDKNATKKVAIMSNEPEHLKLVYLDEEQGQVKVSLKNASGEIIHKTTINNKAGFSQPYDMELLPAGDYTFDVTIPDGTTLSETVTIVKPSNEPNFAANVLNVNDGKKFRLAVVNRDERALPTSIKVYDQNGNTIHEEKVNDLYGFRKIYDLSSVEANQFTFEIKNASGTRYLNAY
ncbi:hypothetical protein [Fulvivirga sp.]|uniref:hypothetical protein n=2 Tax=Fulvivirga sp. TaxID=1931237 RepID=UPI0032EE93B3